MDQTLTNLNSNKMQYKPSMRSDMLASLDRNILQKPSSAHPTRRRQIYNSATGGNPHQIRGLQKNKTTIFTHSKVVDPQVEDVRGFNGKINISASASNMSAN